ncbi:transposase [Massilibacterium senegalense]|uniref:transposase n=1 Tax=Massilibacterium senegalense TaxID=1632858 RepID=UPI0009393950
MLSLRTEQILTYYSHRWRIETYFQQVKGQLGFQGYQIRSRRAIERFWLLVQFSYLFFSDLYGQCFTQTIHLVRRDTFMRIFEFVHTATGSTGYPSFIFVFKYAHLELNIYFIDFK